ncbi:MAG: hypothetical protein JJE25_13335 [Bacteroidia bacterium]|nr:hypothetical protein [Bacteroidia bacterium]
MENNDPKNSPSSNETQEQGPRKSIVIIVIAILLGTNGLLLWQFFEKKASLDEANQTVITTTAEKDHLQMELNQVKGEFEKIKAENTNLREQLTAKDDEIKAKVAEIQKLIAMGGPAQIAKAKAEILTLRQLNQTYAAQLDSIRKVNTQLLTENTDLSSNLMQQKSQNENLSKENQTLSGKVAAGSVLKATAILTEGVRYRSSGKEIITNKAKSVQKLRVRFVLVENKVIDKGNVNIYVRILGPDGAVMSSDQESFIVDGKAMVYTSKESVPYENKDATVEVMWSKGSAFAKGHYTIEIYQQGGYLIGTSFADMK